MTKVKTADARAALEQLVRERVGEAAGQNGVVSRREAQALEPFLARAAAEARADAGPGARLRVDQVVQRARTNADALWARHNPPGGRGGAYLSRAEVQAIAADDPGLGALTRLAVLRASQATGAAGARGAAERFLRAFDYRADPNTGLRPLHRALPGGETVDLRPQWGAEGRAAAPTPVVAAFDLYDRGNGWSTCTAQRTKLDGHEVWLLYTSGDGDDAYVEVYDKKGQPLASARVFGESLVGVDEVFGRCRYSVNLVALDAPSRVEASRAPAARAAAGLAPSGWRGDVELTQGRLERNEYGRLTRVDAPALGASPRQELGLAALEYLWDASLRLRAQDGAPFLLGADREGTLSLGEWTRPDGQRFEVAAWADRAGPGATLYFTRDAGRLRLAVEALER